MSDRRAADHKYSVSDKGRERRRRADAAYAHKRRARKYGVEPHHVDALLQQQTGPDGVARCPLTGKPLDSKAALDHAHDMVGVDSLRGLVDRQTNTILPNDDAGLARFASNLLAYSGKRQRLHQSLKCSSLQTRGRGPHNKERQ